MFWLAAAAIVIDLTVDDLVNDNIKRDHTKIFQNFDAKVF